MRGRLADAGHEGYFPALPAAELGGGEQPGDLGALARAGPAVARRGPVLQPRQQVCAGGLREIGILSAEGGQIGVDAVPGARVLPDRQSDPARAGSAGGDEAGQHAGCHRTAAHMAQGGCRDHASCPAATEPGARGRRQHWRGGRPPARRRAAHGGCDGPGTPRPPPAGNRHRSSSRPCSAASYEHAYDLVRAHAEAGWTARLVPLTAALPAGPARHLQRKPRSEGTPPRRLSPRRNLGACWPQITWS
jgi:hypothetical protein